MKQNGSNLRVYRNGVLIAYERDFTFTIDNNLPDASNKDSGGFAEHIRGQKSATLDFTALVDLTATYGMPEALNELIDRGEITASWQLVDGATEFYAGRASYSTISSDASNEDVVLWAGSLTINGDFGIYPVSLTRTLKTDNINSGLQSPFVFGFDSSNRFYYVNNSNGDVYGLKNGIESVINADFAAGDFISFGSDTKAFAGFGDSSGLVKIVNGVDSILTIPNWDTCDAFFVDGDYIYYTHSTTLVLVKYNWRTLTTVWSTNTGENANCFQIIKQSTHIVLSIKDGSSDAWTLEVFNEVSGAFIRSVAVVTDADTIGVWLAVNGTNLYASYSDGTNTYLKKLTFNSASLSSSLLSSTGVYPTPVRCWNNKIYSKISNDGDINILSSSDVQLGIVDTVVSGITDFTINNGILIAYKSSNTTIKTFAV